MFKNFIFWLFDLEREVLKPGNCECGHIRSIHKNGKGRCKGSFPPDEETDCWTGCSCQIYIKDDDDDNGDENLSPTPTPSELEKLFQQ